jgi:uncharacterized membrane protein
LDWLEILIVSAMPFSELRGGIPLGIYLGLSPVEAYFIAVLGNILPVPFLLVFLDKIGNLAERWSLTAKIYSKVVNRVERKKEIIEKYGYLGLTLFVAVPLPVTGAWTGTLLAFLLRLNKLKSLAFISLGVAIAGVVVTLASLGFTGLLC